MPDLFIFQFYLQKQVQEKVQTLTFCIKIPFMVSESFCYLLTILSRLTKKKKASFSLKNELYPRDLQRLRKRLYRKC